MKAYIAGRITGDPNYKEKFRRAAKLYKDLGMVVLDPSELPEGMEPGDYMRLCLAMLETADIVHFLDDWEKSPGARLEMAWCRYVGKVYIVSEKKGTSSSGEGKEAGDGEGKEL